MKKKDQILLEQAYQSIGNNQNISKMLLDLQSGISRSPSVASLTKEMEAIDDMFNVYGVEKKNELIQQLTTLKQKIDNQYNISDSTNLPPGTQAPNSQIVRVIQTLQQGSPSQQAQALVAQQPITR
jgi:hypothetical protein